MEQFAEDGDVANKMDFIVGKTEESSQVSEMAMMWGRSTDARDVRFSKCRMRLHAFTWITVRSLLFFD